MKKKDILKRLENEYESLTPSYQKIANYILMNYKFIPAISSSEISNNIGVSDATIIRFCQSLGYSGFSEFKNTLLKEINSSAKTPVDKMIKAIHHMGEENRDYANAFQNELLNLKKTIINFDADILKKSVDEIDKANTIYIVGIGSCGVIANLLYYHLKRLGLNCEMNTSGGLALYEDLCKMTENDVLIIASFPRYSIDSYNAIKQTKNFGAKSILITDSSESKLASISDYILIAASDNPMYFYNSYIGPISLSNMLILEYAMRNKEKSLDYLGKMKKMGNFYV